MHPTLLWHRLRQLPGFLAGFTAVVVVWLLSTLGGLRALDHAFYDVVVGVLGEPTRATHQVVLVEAEDRSTHDWAGITSRLLAAGAREVAFVLPLDAPSLAALAAGQAERVIIGRPPETRASGSLRPPDALPDGLDARLRTGLLWIDRDEAGSPRRQRGELAVGPRTQPTLEGLAARGAGIAHPPREFGINYHRGTMLPRVSAQRLEREAPLPELVAGRTILVGHAAAPHLARYDAPATDRPRQLTALEVHALALDTLLQDKAVREFSPAESAFGLLASGLLLLLAFQPLRLFSAFWVSVALIAGSLPLAWASLRLFDAWPPAVELALMTGLVLPLVYRAKTRTEDLRLRELLADTSAKLQNRLLPSGFAETDEHWIYVANLVDQILQLRRTIFLERVQDDHRVREIRALRCSIGDIDELRRDYMRIPYTLAIEERGVVEIDVEKRPFLKVQDDPERQFLAPLTFGGDVLGFWAFGLAPEAVGDFERFRARVDDMAQQIGQLLYQRQIWLSRRRDEGEPWRRYLSDDAITVYGSLSRAIVALERRVSSFEHLFAGLSTAAIVFDLFGRVVLVNERMSRLLASAGIAPFEMTAADLIERLSGQRPDQVRETVHTLLASDTPTILPAHLNDDAGSQFLLSARSLRQDPESTRESTPFHSNGLLLELIDVSEIHRLFGVKGELVSYLNHLVNNQLATVLGATQLLGRQPSALPDLAPLIDAQCRKAAATVARAQDLLARDLDVDFGGSYPIDPRTTLQAVVDALHGQAQERGIGFALDMPTTPVLVYANPGALADILHKLAEFLLRDAADDTEIRVTLIEREGGGAVLELANTGFGMPQDRLDAALRDPDGAHDAHFAALREALRQISHWGGSAHVSTALGEGFFVNVSLRTFS